jgi:hypothetical protein
MWVPCSQRACGWKAYTATGPDSPSDALLFSSRLISLKPVGVSPLSLQGAHDIALSAVSICSFVSVAFTLCYLLSDHYLQVVSGLYRCCWISIASPTSALASSLLQIWIHRRLPDDRFRPRYLDLDIFCILRSSYDITESINWIFSLTTRYDFLCPEKHTGLLIPEFLKAATQLLDSTRYLYLSANRHTADISFSQNVYTSGRTSQSIRGLCSGQQCIDFEYASTELS